MRSLFVVALLSLLFGCAVERDERSASAVERVESRVSFNGRPLDEAELEAFVQRYGVAPVSGDYWFDSRSGLWGRVGERSSGFLLPDHDFGNLRADASSGDSRVFLNGRELDSGEAWLLSQIEPSWNTPGVRWWLDAAGDFGSEGRSKPSGNLYSSYRNNEWSIGSLSNIRSSPWVQRFSRRGENDDWRRYVSVPGYRPIDRAP